MLVTTNLRCVKSQKSDDPLVCPCCLTWPYWGTILSCWAGVILNSYGTPLHSMFFKIVVICKLGIWLLVDCFTFIWEYRFSWQCILSLWCGIYSHVQISVLEEPAVSTMYTENKGSTFSEALVPLYQITQYHITEDHNIIIKIQLLWNHSLFIWQIIDIIGTVHNLLTKLNKTFIVI